MALSLRYDAHGKFLMGVFGAVVSFTLMVVLICVGWYPNDFFLSAGK